MKFRDDIEIKLRALSVNYLTLSENKCISIKVYSLNVTV